MDNYAKDLTEVYYIINKLQLDLKEKIPKDLIEIIREKMDKKYIPIGRDISDRASAMLSVIYSDYICEGEEKSRWERFDSSYMYETLNKNFNSDKVFKTAQGNIVQDDSGKYCDNKKELLVAKARRSRLKDIIINVKNIFHHIF